MKKGLVIEGGGLRGAYTAGALTWLIDNEVKFDYGVGISIGALYLGAFLTANKRLLKEYAINLASDKDNVGIKPLLKYRTLVGYDDVFRKINQDEYKIDVIGLNQSTTKAEIGVYDLNRCETVWITNREFDQDNLFIKAACTLPMFGRKVNINGIDYLDGGITTMIPIKQSLANDNQRHLVITTKPDNYVRKPYSKFVLWLFKVVYRKYPKLSKDIAKRDQAYYDEIALVKSLVKKQEAIYVNPTKDIGVTRFGGNKEQLTVLFELGYQDMESRKQEIIAFLKVR